MLLKEKLENSTLHLVNEQGIFRHLDFLFGHRSNGLVAKVFALLNKDPSLSGYFTESFGKHFNITGEITNTDGNFGMDYGHKTHPTHNTWQTSESSMSYDELMKRLHQYKHHIFVAYNISIGNDPSKFEWAELNKRIENSGEECVGECKELRDLIKKINRYLSHIKKTYLSGVANGTDNIMGKVLVRGNRGYYVPDETEDTANVKKMRNVFNWNQMEVALKFFKAYYNLRKYSAYILTNYHMRFEYTTIEQELNKVEELKSKVNQLGQPSTFDNTLIRKLLNSVHTRLNKEENANATMLNKDEDNFETIYKLRKHAKYISLTYNITFDYNMLESELGKLDELADRIHETDEHCITECYEIASLLKDALGYIQNKQPDEANSTKNNIFHGSNWKKVEYTSIYFETLVKLRHDIQYISNTFHVTFNYSNIESEVMKLKELAHGVYEIGEDCVSECTEIRSLFHDVKQSLDAESFDGSLQWINTERAKKYITIIISLEQYVTYITNTFHINFDYNKLETEFKKLEDLVSELEEFGAQCTTEGCKEIRKIIESAYGATVTKVPDDPSYFDQSVSKYIEVLNKIKHYWTNISSTYKINLEYTKIESEFRKIEQLASITDKFADECLAECLEIRNLLSDISRSSNEDNAVNTWDWNDSETTIKYYEVLFKLKKHAMFITTNYNIQLNYENILAELKKLEQLSKMYEPPGYQCTGYCAEIRESLKHVRRYLIHIKEIYFGDSGAVSEIPIYARTVTTEEPENTEPTPQEEHVTPVEPENTEGPTPQEEPVTPVEPENTEGPTTEEEPVSPVEPENTEGPTTEEEPVSPVEPENTEGPTSEEEPVNPVEPENTEGPTPQEENVAPVEPENTEGPTPQEEPVTPVEPENTEGPTTEEEPVSPVEPENTEGPTSEEEPVTPVEPENTEGPTTEEEPVSPVEPENTEGPTSEEEPVNPVEPENTEGPTPQEENVAPVEPENTEGPTPQEEYVTPVQSENTEGPTTEEEPVTPVEPENTEGPTTEEEPVSPVEPENTEGPTSEEEPVNPVEPENTEGPTPQEENVAP
ncbi:hypothetical protein J6590_030839, partial [Homalodisca vitripennis]